MILLMLATGIKSSSCNGTNWSEKKRSKAKSSTKIDKSWPCLKNSVSFAEKKQIPKINFTMHLYTLWSCGKIKDF
jgi:hypothetical protein